MSEIAVVATTISLRFSTGGIYINIKINRMQARNLAKKHKQRLQDLIRETITHNHLKCISLLQLK